MSQASPLRLKDSALARDAAEMRVCQNAVKHVVGCSGKQYYRKGKSDEKAF